MQNIERLEDSKIYTKGWVTIQEAPKPLANENRQQTNHQPIKTGSRQISQSKQEADKSANQ